MEVSFLGSSWARYDLAIPGSFRLVPSDSRVDGKVAEPLLAIRRSRLVRALRFYLEKARRHYLVSAQYERFRQQLDRLMTDGSNYKFTEPSIPNRGYIFCPEYTSSDPFKISDNGAATTTILFGATTMPDLAVGVERSPSPIEPKTPPAVVADKDSSSVASSDNETMAHEGTIKPIPRPLENSTTVQIADEKVAETKAVLIRFGVDKSSNEPVEWSVSSSANPHLMIVGFPGMGKTEAVLNICQQLKAQSITPIVFSYHPDIETDFRSNEATRKVPRAVLSRRFPKSSSCQTRSSELRLITTVSDKATRCNHEKWANFDTN